MYSYFINFCVFFVLVFVKYWYCQVQIVIGYKYYVFYKDDCFGEEELDEELDNYYMKVGDRLNINVNVWDMGDSMVEFNEFDVSV